MNRRLLLLLPIIIIVGVGAIIAQGPWAKEEPQGIRVEIYLYRNGELVFYDPDDPAVNNFLAWLADNLDSGVTYAGVARNGAAANNPYLWYGAVAVGLSNGTGAFGRDMSTLPGTIFFAFIDPSQITINNNELVISGTVTVTAAMNVTWVGLFVDYSQDNGNWDGDELLLFADPVTPAIQVNAGDVVTVVYKIVVP